MRRNGTLDQDRQLVEAARREAASLAALDPLHPLGKTTVLAAPPETDTPADLPNGYRLVRLLRAGAQGLVYEAMQNDAAQPLAIKILRDSPGAAHDRIRLQREASLLTRLDHPNIVRMLDCGQTPSGRFFAVMEYIDGRPIDRHVLDLDLPPIATVRLFIKIAEAVGAAHLRGIIHRDLKSSNILVDSTGEPRVLDFGLAKILPDASGAHDTAATTSGFLGTLAWASPEQLRGRADDLDLRTDVYSLGVLLYFLLTNRMPHDTDLPIRDAAESIVSGEPARPRTLNRAIPRDIETIILKCLSKDRDRRYNSANELAADLRRALAGEAIIARRDSALHLARTIIRKHKFPAALAATFLILGLSSGAIMGGMYAGSQQQLQAAQQDNEELRAELAQLKTQLVQPGNWTSAFASGEAISKLPPEEGWAVVKAAWNEMTEDHPKQQLLKSMTVGASTEPQFLIHAMHLGATDPSPAVQNWAFIYLRNIAFFDFAEDFSAYAPWYQAHKDMPVTQARRENLRRFVRELTLDNDRDYDRKLEMLARSWVFRTQPDLMEVATETGLTEHLLILIADPDTPNERRSNAGSILAHAALDEATLRKRIIPLLGRDHSWSIRSTAARILQMRKPRFAVPALLETLTDAVAVRERTDGLDLWAISGALGEIGDPSAIPTMIAVIDADNTYDTIYGVGYFGLGKITGVRYEDTHDGAWWRQWWEKNKMRFPTEVQQLQIPDLPTRPGRTPRRTAAPAKPVEPAGPPQTHRIAGDENKTYLLNGPHPDAEKPENGWRLLLILPGGDGSADFQPFVSTIYKKAVPAGYIQAQLIAPRWSDQQAEKLVWPTRGNTMPEAKFTTEDFIKAVVQDIAKSHPLDSNHIYALGWSSGGPPIYAAATDPDSPLTGAFVVMSVFHPKRLDLAGAKDRAFFILHSPQDFIQMRFPQAARDQLAAAGATTTLATYDGGHGWHGDIFGNIRNGIDWLEAQTGNR